jgi:hypothetical protein
MDEPLSPGERVSEFFTRCERGRSRGKDFELWKSIRTDFEHTGRIAELMNLVKHDDRLRAATIKQLRVGHDVLGRSRPVSFCRRDAPRKAMR